MEDYVGLSLGGGQEQEGPSCPDCGGPMEHVPFRVEAESEEVARRVFMAYAATLDIPLSVLEAVLIRAAHFHGKYGRREDCTDPLHDT